MGYGELCRFVYALMMKVCTSGGLPTIHSWQEYMDKEKFAEFPRLPMDQFLADHAFGRRIAASKDSGTREFRRDCYSFIVRLIELILGSVCSTSVVARGLCCFCPELLLEGDDVAVFALYGDLVSALDGRGYLSADIANASVDEFRSYVVEARRNHSGSAVVASSIADVVTHLMKDFAFQSRHNLVRVFKLCCLVAVGRSSVMPVVTLESSDCVIPQIVLHSCMRIVQSYVLNAGYHHQSFFSSSTLEQVRLDIQGARDFMTLDSYSPWDGIVCDGVDDFIRDVRDLFCAHLSRKRRECESFYEEANRTNRELQSASREGSVVGSSSNLSSVMRRKKDAAKMVTVSGLKSTRGRGLVASSSRGSLASSARGSGRGSAVKNSSSGKGRKNKKSGEEDPTFTL